MDTTTPQYRLAQAVADRFSQLSEVEAVAVAGSTATGRANAQSDVDVYVYPSVDLPPDLRLSIGREFSPQVQISDYWGPSINWVDGDTGIEIEAMFFNTRWMEDLVLRPLEQHKAQMGFTTSFWHTIKVSKILFDRSGWLTRLQEKASQPYPTALARAIVALNYPLLRDIHYSYRAQLEQVLRRGDLVVVTRNVWEFLASYFDILFALNRMPHPGIKRMIDIVERDCAVRPAQLREHVTELLRVSSLGAADTLEILDHIVDELTPLLQKDGLLP